ncbi:uncharacterized protein METZ01_LOCUS85889, partial [marine metagenome]
VVRELGLTFNLSISETTRCVVINHTSGLNDPIKIVESAANLNPRFFSIVVQLSPAQAPFKTRNSNNTMVS